MKVLNKIQLSTIKSKMALYKQYSMGKNNPSIYVYIIRHKIK